MILTCSQKLNIEVSFDAAGQERNYWNTAGKAGEEYFLLVQTYSSYSSHIYINAEEIIEWLKRLRQEHNRCCLFYLQECKMAWNGGLVLEIATHLLEQNLGLKMFQNRFLKSINGVSPIWSNPYIWYDSKKTPLYTH